MKRPAVLRQVESHLNHKRVTPYRLRLSDATALIDYVRELEGRTRLRPPGKGDQLVKLDAEDRLLPDDAPETFDPAGYVCTRSDCGRSADDARENGCVRGPCPMDAPQAAAA